MNPHETRPIEIRPGRRARRRAEQRRRFIQHLLASFILAGTALVLVLLFGQSEPPMVEATLPDKPEEEVVNDEGLVLDRESVLAPVASGRPVNGAERPADGRTAPGGTPGAGQPPPSISAIPAPPVDEPPRAPAEANSSPTPDDHVDDEPREQNGSPPPPPVTTSPPVAVDEELTRPPLEPIVDPACWDGWTYDEQRRQCVREDDDPEPADKTEDGEEGEQEQPEETEGEEESSRGDLGGASKGTGSVLDKNVEVTR